MRADAYALRLDRRKIVSPEMEAAAKLRLLVARV